MVLPHRPLDVQIYVLLGSRESMVIMTLSPVVTATLSFFFFGEQLNLIQLLGMAITISGVTMMTLWTIMSPRWPVSAHSTAGILYDARRDLQSISFLLAKAALTEGPISTNLMRNLRLGGLHHLQRPHQEGRQSPLQEPGDRRASCCCSGRRAGLGMSSQKAFTLALVGLVTTITQVSPILLLPYDRLISSRTISPASLVGTVPVSASPSSFSPPDTCHCRPLLH